MTRHGKDRVGTLVLSNTQLIHSSTSYHANLRLKRQLKKKKGKNICTISFVIVSVVRNEDAFLPLLPPVTGQSWSNLPECGLASDYKE